MLAEIPQGLLQARFLFGVNKEAHWCGGAWCPVRFGGTITEIEVGEEAGEDNNKNEKVSGAHF